MCFTQTGTPGKNDENYGLFGTGDNKTASGLGGAPFYAVADVLKGLTAPSPQAGTRQGATNQFNLLSPYLNTLLSGGNAPDIRGLLQAYSLQRANLQGANDRAVSQAGLAGLGQASQMNLSNPFMYSNFLQDRANAQYAPQFGNLAASQAEGIFGANRSFLNQLLQGQNQLISMGAGSKGNLFGY